MARARRTLRGNTNHIVQGNQQERRDRNGLSYEYQIRLRKVQRERVKEEQVSKETKEARKKKEADFQLRNVVNQRASTSLQASYRNYYGYDMYYRGYQEDTILTISVPSYYNEGFARDEYKNELINERKNKVTENDESEFRNPLSIPLRGLDEDESDVDYMEGREIRRELRTSHQFEEMFHKYICEREKVDKKFAESVEGLGSPQVERPQLEAGTNEIRLARQEGQSDEDYFEACLTHSFSLISSIEAPDLLRKKPTTTPKNEKEKTVTVVSSLSVLVETFKLFYEEKVENLDDCILALAFGLQLLNINYFWKDLRSFMRRDHEKGLKKIVLLAGLQSGSQLIQEALIELLYDLSFSDFEGQQVNRILYFDCQEVIRRWLGTPRWNSQQTLSSFFELLDDLFWSQVVVNKPKVLKDGKGEGVQTHSERKDTEKKNQGFGMEGESDSEEEEEKEIEHGMEDITESIELKSKLEKEPETNQLPSGSEEPQIYHRKDDFFKAFLSTILYNLLNQDYRLNVDAPTVFESLEKSWETPQNDESLLEKEEDNQKEHSEEDQTLDSDLMNQLELEDDGISLGSNTTTECSEYSEDLIDDEEIKTITLKFIQSISSAFVINDSNGVYSNTIGSSSLLSPKQYVKDKMLYSKDFISFFDDWVKITFPGQNREFKNLEIFMNQNYFQSTTKVFLTQLKFSQFENLDAKAQIKFLKELNQESISMLYFKSKDYADDLLVEILRGRMKDAPPNFNILNKQGYGGLWGDLFYKRPAIWGGISMEEQYKQPKWVRKAQLYEEAVDQIHKILKEGGENLQFFIKFLAAGIMFTTFIRSILKPEVGNPMKKVVFKELKRSDFLPFKIDHSYEVVDIDLKEIDFGENVYIYRKKTDEDQEEFCENKLFYLSGPRKLFTMKELEVTREELLNYPDSYRYTENWGDIFEEEAQENQNQENPNRDENVEPPFGFFRNNNQQQQQEENRKGRKNNPPEEEQEQLYRIKKYSILKINQRESAELAKIEKYDKLNNYVSLDMLRSGEALLKKHRSRVHQPGQNNGFNQGDLFGGLFQGFGQQPGQSVFARTRLYSMIIPTRIFDNFHCQKFVNFILTDDRNFENGGTHECLYVKKLKKIVFRKKNRSYFDSSVSMLRFERVTCKGKVVDFDDPSQRDEYYNRLFKLTSTIHKKPIKVKTINEEEGSLPAHRIHTFYSHLYDYTTRSEKLMKNTHYDKMAEYSFSSPFLAVLEDGQTMDQPCPKLLLNKVMPKGQSARYEVNDKSKNLSCFYFDFDRYNNDLDVYEQLYQKGILTQSKIDLKSKMDLFFHYSDQRRHEKFFNEYNSGTVMLRPLKCLDEEEGGDGERAFVHVVKEGTKKIFRLELEPGLRVGLHSEFRRMFVLKVLEDRLELRVVSFDAISKYVNNYLSNC